MHIKFKIKIYSRYQVTLWYYIIIHVAISYLAVPGCTGLPLIYVLNNKESGEEIEYDVFI